MNSLTINAPVINTAGASTSGLFVRGATTLAGNTTFNLGGSNGIVLGGKVSGGEKVEDAFRSVLGTPEAAFVRRWRADLRDLAGGVAG